MVAARDRVTGAVPSGIGGADSPSTRRSGSHSSHNGRYQLRLPSSSIAAGTSTMRTTVASSVTANARPKPNCWNITRSPSAKPPKTTTMIAAAPVMMFAVERSPKATELALSTPWS